MNQLWRPPDQCTCGCDPCQCQECPPLFVDERLLDCWRQISAFKKMIENIIAEMGVTSGDAGPAGPQGVAGPQGAQGPAGAPGPAGMAVSYVGDTQPSNPTNGELWVKSDGSLHIYEDPPGQWVDISSGGVGTPGPAGPMGPQGMQGIQGPVGPQGPQGNSGPAGSQGATGPSGTLDMPDMSIGVVGSLGLFTVPNQPQWLLQVGEYIPPSVPLSPSLPDNTVWVVVSVVQFAAPALTYEAILYLLQRHS